MTHSSNVANQLGKVLKIRTPPNTIGMHPDSWVSNDTFVNQKKYDSSFNR